MSGQGSNLNRTDLLDQALQSGRQWVPTGTKSEFRRMGFKERDLTQAPDQRLPQP
jgi:hypothetical protein